MSTPEEYQAKAEDTLVQLAAATNETERVRLRRAHGAYLKLATHGAEAAERAAMKPAARIVPEKPSATAGPKLQGWSIR
jgi:archaeosine-15-forming tRNA-guanine transglycosylase